MAIPADPTVTSIVTDALRHAGQFSPTSGQISELATQGFQTVKTEMWAACETDKLLESTIMIILPIGSGQVDTPADFDHEITLDVYSCTDNFAFTATAGQPNQITAASTFSADISAIRGMYIFTTSGVGLRQYRQIIDYSDTTKIITVTPTWGTPPTNNTTAFIGNLRKRLVMSDPGGWNSSSIYPNQGFPHRYRMVGVSPLNTDAPAIEIAPVPDTANYAMLLTYGPNLTLLNETDPLFIRHLREWRTVWTQGTIVQASRRYDEARYLAEESKWQLILRRYASHNPTYDRAEPER